MVDVLLENAPSELVVASASRTQSRSHTTRIRASRAAAAPLILVNLKASQTQHSPLDAVTGTTTLDDAEGWAAQLCENSNQQTWLLLLQDEALRAGGENA